LKCELKTTLLCFEEFFQRSSFVCIFAIFHGPQAPRKNCSSQRGEANRHSYQTHARPGGPSPCDLHGR
jgi:hypothetical protein